MKLKIQSLILFSLVVFNLHAIDYYVDGSNGNDTNDGSDSNPFLTLGHALDVAESSSVEDIIYLMGNGEYVVTSNSILSYWQRLISSDLTIVGSPLDVNAMPTIRWEAGVWGYCIKASNCNVNIEGVKFDFSSIQVPSYTCFYLTSSTIANCYFSARPPAGFFGDAYCFFHSSLSDDFAVLSCFFEGVTSYSSDMSSLVYAYSEYVSINPLYLDASMDKAYHIYEGVGVIDKIVFGEPEFGDNILISPICSTKTIADGNYGEILVEESVTANLAGNISASDLVLKDGANFTAPGLSVADEVSVSGDVYYQDLASLGNSTTNVDLVFTPERYRYFTPPFDILASDMGKVEVAFTSSTADETSVWLFEYNEAYKTLNPDGNGWQLITDASQQLKAGKGYCVWTNASLISLSSGVAYPNNTDIIKDNILVSNLDSFSTGYNYLGNPYSLPLQLSASRTDVLSYYYFDGTQYLAMSGTGGIVTGTPLASSGIVVPSYGAFLVHVSAIDAAFPATGLLSNSNAVRIKSEPIVDDPSYIRFALSNGGHYDDLVLRFQDDGSFGVDLFDVDKLYPSGGSQAALLSTSALDGSGDYAIQGLPSLADIDVGDTIVLPLTITSGSVGDFDVSVSLNNIDDDVAVLLFDSEDESLRELNDVDLALSLSVTGTIADRYSLYVVKQSVASITSAIVDSDQFKVVVSDRGFEVKLADNKTADVRVYDINGRVMFQGNTQSSTCFSTNGFFSGVYIVNVSTEGAAPYNQKILVR